MSYIQTDKMQELIDWDSIMPLPRYAGGHDEQMQALFKGATVVGHWNEGDYQGKVATMARLADGRCAIYSDYYGSCSGCDSWEYASDEDVRKMCIDLANSAYVFPSVEEAIAWMESGERPENYGLQGCVGHLLADYRQRESVQKNS